jgi:hypothetical protein
MRERIEFITAEEYLSGVQNKKNASIVAIIQTIAITKVPTIYQGKRLDIQLLNQQKQEIPLYKCLMRGNHVVVSEVIFKSDADAKNFKDPKYRSPQALELSFITFDIESLRSISKQTNELRTKVEEEKRHYATSLQKQQVEFDERLRAATKPFEDIIRERDQKIRELYSQQMVTMLSFQEQFINMIVDAMKDEFKLNTGMTREEFEAKALTLSKNLESKTKELTNRTEFSKNVSNQVDE